MKCDIFMQNQTERRSMSDNYISTTTIDSIIEYDKFFGQVGINPTTKIGSMLQLDRFCKDCHQNIYIFVEMNSRSFYFYQYSAVDDYANVKDSISH